MPCYLYMWTFICFFYRPLLCESSLDSNMCWGGGLNIDETVHKPLLCSVGTNRHKKNKEIENPYQRSRNFKERSNIHIVQGHLYFSRDVLDIDLKVKKYSYGLIYQLQCTDHIIVCLVWENSISSLCCFKPLSIWSTKLNWRCIKVFTDITVSVVL